MSFFKKDVTANFEQDNKVMNTSVIGKEMTITGNISFKGKLRFDGNIKGNISGDYLILGSTGHITGDIMVENFTCQGQVDGNVNAKKLLVISDGTINGKVEATDLSVESGAALNGEIKSRTKDLRLVPGTSIPEDEWEKKLQAIPQK
ncbi:MAG: polymer-forming cytoskeletal protein [Desulfobulbaceae bacterium]|nr:polymer-forming cytoskeletal protein [Desulfobulbaceae bacterium]